MRSAKWRAKFFSPLLSGGNKSGDRNSWYLQN